MSRAFENVKQLTRHSFQDAASLLTSTITPFLTSDILTTDKENLAYSVADPSATDQHVTTSGGVKLYVIPGDKGFDVRAFGAKGDNVADDTIAVQTAINVASKSRTGEVYLPAGIYRCSTLYVTYDASLNPGYSTASGTNGRLTITGDGHCAQVDVVNWNSTGLPQRGTVILGLSTTTSAVVLSTPAQDANPYPVRNQWIKDITIAANTSAWVLENNSASEWSGLDNVSIVQLGTSGGGVLWRSSWYTQWVGVHIGQPSGVVSSNVGLQIGSSIFAGLYYFQSCSFKKFASSARIVGAQTSSNIYFQSCGFENAGSHGLRISAGVRNLKLENCYFEFNGVNHILVDAVTEAAQAIQSFSVSNTFMFGATTAAAAPSGPFIYLNGCRGAEIVNCNFFRPHTTCIDNQVNAGQLTGPLTVSGCSVDISDATYAPGATFNFVSGNSQSAIPTLINNVLPASAVVIPVDTAYLSPVEISTTQVRALQFAFGSVFERAMDAVNETDLPSYASGNCRLYTTTAAGCAVTLPAVSGVAGQVFYIANATTSTQALSVQKSGGSSLVSLSAGDGVICVADPNTTQWVGFTTSFVD